MLFLANLKKATCNYKIIGQNNFALDALFTPDINGQSTKKLKHLPATLFQLEIW
jgi:hypothetical protein